MAPSLAVIRGERGEQPDEQVLVQAVLRGAPEAASAFHRRVWPVVLRTLRRLIRRPGSELEDIAMDSVEQLVLSIDSYRRESSLDRWVSRVTAHVAYGHLRRRRLEAKLFVGDEAGDDAESFVDVHPDPVDLTEQASFRSALTRVAAYLQRLGEDKATCFVLHDVHGYSLEEVAQIVGISPSAAQTRLSRGRRELHELIGADADLATLLGRLGESS